MAGKRGQKRLTALHQQTLKEGIIAGLSNAQLRRVLHSLGYEGAMDEASFRYYRSQPDVMRAIWDLSRQLNQVGLAQRRLRLERMQHLIAMVHHRLLGYVPDIEMPEERLPGPPELLDHATFRAYVALEANLLEKLEKWLTTPLPGGVQAADFPPPDFFPEALPEVQQAAEAAQHEVLQTFALADLLRRHIERLTGKTVEEINNGALDGQVLDIPPEAEGPDKSASLVLLPQPEQTKRGRDKSAS